MNVNEIIINIELNFVVVEPNKLRKNHPPLSIKNFFRLVLVFSILGLSPNIELILHGIEDYVCCLQLYHIKVLLKRIFLIQIIRLEYFLSYFITIERLKLFICYTSETVISKMTCLKLPFD